MAQEMSGVQDSLQRIESQMPKMPSKKVEKGLAEDEFVAKKAPKVSKRKTGLEEVGLIIPDIHEQYDKLRRNLKKYKHVQWVKFLGDYFDTFSGLTEETHSTIAWVHDNAKNPAYELLWGNHDLHYAFPNVPALGCSGYDVRKQKLISARLNDEDHWKRFKLHTWIGKPNEGNSAVPTEWLLSHGGVHPYTIHPVLGYDKAALVDMENEAMFQLRYVQAVTSIVAAGRGRGGLARVGGWDWLDWDREFVAIPGLNQIVGHSNGREIRYINTADSYNWCIDTHLRHVMIVYEDGSVEVRDAE